MVVAVRFSSLLLALCSTRCPLHRGTGSTSARAMRSILTQAEKIWSFRTSAAPESSAGRCQRSSLAPGARVHGAAHRRDSSLRDRLPFCKPHLPPRSATPTLVCCVAALRDVFARPERRSRPLAHRAITWGHRNLKPKKRTKSGEHGRTEPTHESAHDASSFACHSAHVVPLWPWHAPLANSRPPTA